MEMERLGNLRRKTWIPGKKSDGLEAEEKAALSETCLEIV
jgi:hypothetical protein